MTAATRERLHDLSVPPLKALTSTVPCFLCPFFVMAEQVRRASATHSLQLLLNLLSVSRQFDIALAFDRLSSLGAPYRDCSLPIGDLCAACRAQFLIGQEWGQFQ